MPLRAQIRQNVTPLVRELAGAYWALAVSRTAPRALLDLCDMAHNLLLDFDDYETPARAAGWLPEPGDTLARVYLPRVLRDGEDEAFYHAASWREACDRLALTAAALAVRECWCVSEWLAERLEAHGERVCELASLWIWARTSAEPIERDETVRAIWRSTTNHPNDGDRAT